MPSQTLIFWLSIVLYNLIILVALGAARRASRDRHVAGLFRGMLTEKNLSETSASLLRASQEETPSLPTSTSRVIAFVGVVIIVAFSWTLGNVLIYYAIFQPDQIDDLLDGVGSYYLAQSALFAPYAFNQLSQTFK
jgi:hypothetical protein